MPRTRPFRILGWLCAFAILSAAASTAAAQPVPVSPVNLSTGITPAPGLAATFLSPGASIQYQVQVDLNSGMTSNGGGPLYDFNETMSTSFAGVGAFTGQDANIGSFSVSSNAYQSGSTATFSFFSSVAAMLSPNTVYYWHVRELVPSVSAWSSVSNFTTGVMASASPVNNLAITNVTLSNSSVSTSSTAVVSFVITENNTLSSVTANGASYNTADWIFIKFSTQGGGVGTWNHALLAPGGTVSSSATLTLGSDSMGAWLDHSATGSQMSATVNLNMATFANRIGWNSVMIQVYAVAMVHIPTGSFVYNESNLGGTTSNNYNGTAGPQTVASAANIPASAAAGWPNGYSSFYIMRYPISQGQYADFLNSVSATTATVHADTVFSNFGYSMSVNAGVYSTADRNLAMVRMSFFDLSAFLSWAALRPITEMEYERAGRDVAPDARFYPWGSQAPTTPPNYWPPNEGGGPFAQNNMNFGNLSSQSILDVGRYMSSDVYRTAAQTGVSPYGVADLSGNIATAVILCSYLSVPGNGNGSAVFPVSWPNADSYTGYRGGYLSNPASTERLSNRSGAPFAFATRSGIIGGRGGRFP
jgi:hypothetical protein